MKTIIIFTKNGTVETTGQEEIKDWSNFSENYVGTKVSNEKGAVLGYQKNFQDVDFSLLVINLIEWYKDENIEIFYSFYEHTFLNSTSFIISHHGANNIVDEFNVEFKINLNNYSIYSHGTWGRDDEREERKQYLNLVSSIGNNFPEALQNFWNYYQNREKTNNLFKIKTDFLDYITSNNKFPDSLPNELKTLPLEIIMDEWKGKNYDADNKNHVSVYDQLRDELNKLVAAKS